MHGRIPAVGLPTDRLCLAYGRIHIGLMAYDRPYGRYMAIQPYKKVVCVRRYAPCGWP